MDKIAVSACPVFGGQIIHSGKDKSCAYFNPAVAEQLDAGLIDQAHAPVAATVELMVSGDGPDAQRRREAAQDREQFVCGWAMPFKKVPKKDDHVGLLLFDLGDPRRQPAFTD